MRILRGILLKQITLKGEIAKSVCPVQRLQIHNYHNVNGSFNLMRNVHIQSIAANHICHMKNTIKRQYSSQTTQPWWKKLFRVSSSSKSALNGKSMLLYAKSVDNLNHSEFRIKFGMPDSFNSWFLITEIHVWMLMVRGMAEREHGMIIRNGIVAAMWTDSLERAKSMAPGSFGLIKKQIKEISGQFHYAIISYDEGLTTDDKQLASALWKRFFESNSDDYEQIELLVKYIRYNIAQLDKMSSEEFLNQRNINWPSLSDLEKGKLKSPFK